MLNIALFMFSDIKFQPYLSHFIYKISPTAWYKQAAKNHFSPKIGTTSISYNTFPPTRHPISYDATAAKTKTFANSRTFL